MFPRKTRESWRRLVKRNVNYGIIIVCVFFLLFPFKKSQYIASTQISPQHAPIFMDRISTRNSNMFRQYVCVVCIYTFSKRKQFIFSLVNAISWISLKIHSWSHFIIAYFQLKWISFEFHTLCTRIEWANRLLVDIHVLRDWVIFMRCEVFKKKIPFR